MFRKESLLAKIMLTVVVIFLLFMIIIMISYETNYKQHELVDNTIEGTEQVISRTIEPEIGTYDNQDRLIKQNNLSEQEFQDESETVNESTLSITIEPDTSTLAGLIIININSYPSGTDEILIMISPEDTDDPINDPETLIHFLNKNDTEFAIDTTEFTNGNYLLTIASTYGNAPENNPWTAVIKKNYVFDN
jgi:hypothetical protein